MTSHLSNACLIIVLASAAKASGINILQLCKTILAGVQSFCVDILAMTVYAILSAFVLAVVFLGFTAWSSFLVCHEPASNSEFASDQPPALQRWINHTSDVLHVTRLAGTSPLAFFLAVFIPGLLLCLLFRQDARSLTAHASELSKKLSAEQTLNSEKDPAKELEQQVEAIRASLKCNLCARPFWRPHTLAPCGHTFDLDCLQRAFHSAPPSSSPSGSLFGLDPASAALLDPTCTLDLTARPKRCPLPACGAQIPLPPAPAWAVKTVVDAVDADPYAYTEPAPTVHDWEGIFEPESRVGQRRARAWARVHQ
ncbi:hypothetical protein B0H11DRAFT_202418 [Mycena galericulata]|nr:hypothetical protein B0H11DRAFT_202418 [Mycena galericulata]